MITITIGKPGNGKTLYMSKLLLSEIHANPYRDIYTNYPLNISSFKKYFLFRIFPIPLTLFNFIKLKLPFLINHGYVSFYEFNQNQIHIYRDFSELYDLQKAIIILDEAGVHFSARDWSKTPRWFLQKLMVHRHEALDLVMATQRYTGIDAIIRDLAQSTYLVKKIRIPLLKNLFIVRRVEFDEIDGSHSIHFQTWFFGTKKLYSLYDTHGMSAYITEGGSAGDEGYKPSYVLEELEVNQNKDMSLNEQKASGASLSSKDVGYNQSTKKGSAGTRFGLWLLKHVQRLDFLAEKRLKR